MVYHETLLLILQAFTDDIFLLLQFFDDRTYVFARGPGYDVIVAASNGFGGDRSGFSVTVDLGEGGGPGFAGYYNAYDRAETLVLSEGQTSVQIDFDDGLAPKVFVRLF